MQTSFTIAYFRGVPIKVDLSLIILALWLVFEAGQSLGSLSSGLIVGLSTAVLLVLSVALHELGHTAVALKYGCRVRDITLMLIGGRATMLDIPRSPMKEFWMAIAGPAVSAALWLLGTHLDHLISLHARAVGGYTTGSMIVAVIFSWLAMINKGLLLFNLIPAFPMDGGRVLRALLARRMGRLRATYIASRIGRFIAIAMGIYGLIRGRIMLMLIAYFVFTSADNEYRMVQFEEGGFWGRGRGGFGGFGGFRGFGDFFGGGRRDRDYGDSDDDIRVSPPPYDRKR